MARFIAPLITPFIALAVWSLGAITPAKAQNPPLIDCARLLPTSGKGHRAAMSPSRPDQCPGAGPLARSIALRTSLDEHVVLESIRRAQWRPEVIRLIAPAPATFRRNWTAYRSRFIEPGHIAAGQSFMRTNESVLAEAHKRWGIEPEVIAGIIGVETYFGRIVGNFRVLDALTTLALAYAPRSEYFGEELGNFLLWCQKASIDPTSVHGSFAGAIGLPQFMPTSILKYAVDFDGDGHIELRESAADAIASVANFLAEHGWHPGERAWYEAVVERPDDAIPMLGAGLEPMFTPDNLLAHGVSANEPIPPQIRLSLVDLPLADGSTRYLLAANNFYVITRYNRSTFYATAVLELSRALAERRPQAINREPGPGQVDAGRP